MTNPYRDAPTTPAHLDVIVHAGALEPRIVVREAGAYGASFEVPCSEIGIGLWVRCEACGRFRTADHQHATYGRPPDDLAGSWIAKIKGWF